MKHATRLKAPEPVQMSTTAAIGGKRFRPEVPTWPLSEAQWQTVSGFSGLTSTAARMHIGFALTMLIGCNIVDEFYNPEAIRNELRGLRNDAERLYRRLKDASEDFEIFVQMTSPIENRKDYRKLSRPWPADGSPPSSSRRELKLLLSFEQNLVKMVQYLRVTETRPERRKPGPGTTIYTGLHQFWITFFGTSIKHALLAQENSGTVKITGNSCGLSVRLPTPRLVRVRSMLP